MEDQEGQGARPTGFAVTVVVLLVLGFAALFITSSHTIQVIGFAIITIVGIVLLIEFRPRRSERRLIPLRARTNYLPGTGRVVDPNWPEEPGPGEESEREHRRPRRGRGA